MKVPLNWLQEYVPVTLPLPELVERLTLAGLEVGGVRFFGTPLPEGLGVRPEETVLPWDRDKIVVAEVLGIEKHPNADKLKLVTLNYGAAAPKTVVTGAPNIAVGEKGHKVIVGLRGSRYFFQKDENTPKQIMSLEPRNMRGIENDAMVMSAFELGISDEHEGIILLEADAPVGKPLIDFMGDTVVTLDVLPNMARCLAMLGVAREVAALTGQRVKLPSLDFPTAGESVEGKARVEIPDPSLCARYTATVIRDVTIGPAPGWMQRRLTYAGMRPINNIVDVTNYVMLEWGQPLHAFDYDALVRRAGGKAPTIIVRPAKPGEVLETLDGAKRELKPENLVIADTAGPIALAGVMGGAETEVTETTKNILLESASFDFVSIRRTSHAFTLFSEASTRFSKGIHPEVVRPAALRAAQLMQKYAGGRVLKGMVDNYPAPVPPQMIELRASEIRRWLGVDLPAAEVERILGALEFKVERAGPDSWRVTTPPNRLDLQAGEADLIEELVRVHGYDRLPATLLSDQLPPQRGNPDLKLEERVRDLLTNAGLQEVITYALTAPRRADLTPPARKREGDAHDEAAELAAHYVRLLNPISDERTVMRRKLLPGVLEVARRNLSHADALRLFELGPVFLPKEGQALPEEPRRLALVLTGRGIEPCWDDAHGHHPAAMDFFDLKGVVESLAEDLHLPEVSYRPAQEVPYLHPGRSAELLVGGEPVGAFGELHPKTAEAFELEGRTVLVAELDLERILAAAPVRYAYTPMSNHPAALRDIAVIVEESVPASRVLAEMRAAGGELLRDARLFDVYRGEPIPEGSKSLAYALTYQAPDRTLKDAEVDTVHKKIEGRLRHMLKAQIRGAEGKK